MQTRKEAYNGWTNYETWKVQLEVLDGMDLGEKVTKAEVSQAVELIIYDEVPHGSVAESMLTAFLDVVNWKELADTYNDRY